MEGRKKIESVILITKTFSSRTSVSNPISFGRAMVCLCVHVAGLMFAWVLLEPLSWVC